MKFIRQSWLERFRLSLTTEYVDEAEVADNIRGIEKLNWKMEAGTCWHDMLADQSSPVLRYGRVSEKAPQAKYHFAGEAVLGAKQIQGQGLFEVYGERILKLPSGEEVMLTGHADHLWGNAIRDNKTKFGDVSIADYESSLQWRVYLWIFNAHVFTYDLWDFKPPEEDGFCKLDRVVSCTFYPYLGMEEHIRGWVVRFMEWASDRNLLPYLKEGEAA
jgi:hypothetical protein